jgi:hypothetical protein
VTEHRAARIVAMNIDTNDNQQLENSVEVFVRGIEASFPPEA